MLLSPLVLTAARVQSGMSQGELASAAGMSLSVVQALEQGRSDPKNSTLLALRDALLDHGVRLIARDDGTLVGSLIDERPLPDGRYPRRRRDAVPD